MSHFSKQIFSRFHFYFASLAVVVKDILIKFNRINTNKIKIQMKSMQMNWALEEFVIRSRLRFERKFSKLENFSEKFEWASSVQSWNLNWLKLTQ